MTVDGTEEVALRPADPADDATIAAAIELGNRGSSTLGHLPFAAYRDAAEGGCLLIARAGDVIVGFALFAATKRWIRLSQLYVEPSWRRRGIARRLVDWIAERFGAYPGIRVKCRRDYGLAPVWTALGFARGGEIAGRGRERHVLVVWWRDHNHPKLFDWNRPEVLVRASVDMNVIRDREDSTRPGHQEALALFGDEIADRLELVRTGSLDIEIDGLGDAASRDRCASLARDLDAAPSLPGVVDTVLGQLLAAVPADFAARTTGARDLRYVSEAIAAGLTVFVTQDQELIRVAGPLAADRDLRILLPADVIVRIDEIADAGAYRPAAVGHTSYRIQRLGVGSDDLLLSMANTLGGERLPTLRRRIRDLTARGAARHGVFAPDGTPAAAYLTGRAATSLEVMFLRAAAGPLSDTLLRQLLFRLRAEARASRLSAIRITDEYLTHSAQSAVLDDGFLRADRGFIALVVDVCGSARQIHDAACQAARSVGIPEPASIRTGVPQVVAGFERAWWPAKVVDGPLPTFLVPIRQPFATPLLGYPPGLFALDDVLGLRREHVYYRSPRGGRPSSPGRILWYASGGGRRAPAPPAVVGCWPLDAVVGAAPRGLPARVRPLGGWGGEQVVGVAHDGVAQALHFSGTEVFTNPIQLRRMRNLGVDAPLSPRQITPDAFAVLYHEGRGYA